MNTDSYPTVEIEGLTAPFPWFGGKRRIARQVWQRFGDVSTYNEPFAGSLAVLLGRPHPPRIETVNDLDYYIVNFWRAVQVDPEGVARWADGPVNEADLHSRHRWLVARGRRLVARCARDPHYFNVKIAGWWVWGQCLWIGSGWCALTDVRRQNPSEQAKKPDRGGKGVHGKRFAGTGNGQGAGVHSTMKRYAGMSQDWEGRPHLMRDKGVAARKFDDRFDRDAAGTTQQKRRWQGGGQGGGSGVHAPSLWKQLPDLSGDSGASGRGIHGALLSENLVEYMLRLAARLRRVRVCCGDWQRVLTPSVTTYIGMTGVLLDPPYSQDLRQRCYAEDHNVSQDVRAWALAHGDDPNFRIALCGYVDEHGPFMPDTWDVVAWKAHGGYSRTERGVANRDRERIWFSPHCLK